MYKQRIISKLRSFCLAFLFLFVGTASFANDPIDLNEGKIDPTETIPDHGKSPIEIPTVSQDGYQIVFESSHSDYTLELMSGDVVVFSTFVSTTTTTVNLPSYLEGQYEIRLYDFSPYYFYGYIEL